MRFVNPGLHAQARGCVKSLSVLFFCAVLLRKGRIGSLLEQALVERQAYRLDAALLLYDAAAVALAATAAAADLQSSGGTAAEPGLSKEQ